MKLFRRFKSPKAQCVFIFSWVWMSIFAVEHSYCGEQEEALLRSSALEIEVAVEDLFYSFSDFVLKKYCRSQYDELTTYLSDLYSGRTNFTLTELLNQKERFVIELLQECTEREAVIQLEYQFIEHMANRSADLNQRLRGLLENAELDQDFDQKEALLRQVIEVELQLNFKVDKVFDELVVKGTQSQINAEHLADVKGVHSGADAMETEILAELDQMAKARSQKKTLRCSAPGCGKRLGVTPYHCKCGQDYCMRHRADHPCSFDYRAKQQKELEDKLPKVEADRVPNRI